MTGKARRCGECARSRPVTQDDCFFRPGDEELVRCENAQSDYNGCTFEPDSKACKEFKEKKHGTA